jgi:hypothetical protein
VYTVRESCQKPEKKKRITSHKLVSNDKNRRAICGNRRSRPDERPKWRGARAGNAGRCACRGRENWPRPFGTIRRGSRSGIEERRANGGMRGSGSFLPVGVDDVLPSRSTTTNWRWNYGKEVDRELRMLALALRWSMRFLKSDRVELYARRRHRRRGAL